MSKAMTQPFVVTRRVEFHETDMAGIVHFSNFFRYMEFAEQEFLRARGLSFVWRDDNGERLGFPRVAASCDYLRPARYEDELEIRVGVGRIGAKSVTYEFEFHGRGQMLARGKITVACCRKNQDGSMASVEIPTSWRSKIEADPN